MNKRILTACLSNSRYYVCQGFRFWWYLLQSKQEQFHDAGCASRNKSAVDIRYQRNLYNKMNVKVTEYNIRSGVI